MSGKLSQILSYVDSTLLLIWVGGFIFLNGGMSPIGMYCYFGSLFLLKLAEGFFGFRSGKFLTGASTFGGWKWRLIPELVIDAVFSVLFSLVSGSEGAFHQRVVGAILATTLLFIVVSTSLGLARNKWLPLMVAGILEGISFITMFVYNMLYFQREAYGFTFFIIFGFTKISAAIARRKEKQLNNSQIDSDETTQLIQA